MALRQRQTAHHPGTDILIRLVQQRLKLIKLLIVQTIQIALDKAPKENVGFLETSIAAAQYELLAAGIEIVRHGIWGFQRIMIGREDVVQEGPGAKAGTPVTLPRDPSLFPLFASVQTLSGVGPGLMASLRRLLGRDEPRVLDLLLQPPLAERSFDALDDLSAMADGAKVTLVVKIGKHTPSPRQSKAPYKIMAFAQDIPVELAFFHARGDYLSRQFPEDSRMLIHGRLSQYRDRWQMAHPERLPDDATERQRAALVYGLSEGLTQAKLKKLLEQALERLPRLPEWQEASKPGFEQALRTIHGFETGMDREKARQRLARDELLAGQLAIQSARRATKRQKGMAARITGLLQSRLLQSLPFEPTNAQRRAIGDIREDMASPNPMLRLLMGDVGSGKTLVALAVMLDCIETGRQAVLMAPTEILARQHAQSLQALVQPLGLEIGLLTASEKPSGRQKVKQALAEGQIKIVTGTHALFQDGVTFRDLGLVVIDEQHRFGVNQRMDLIAKGDAPDVLLMTATPIPRSLILAHYGDIETSALREKPPGRQPIQTSVLAHERLDDVLAAIGRATSHGDRVYWVCPNIEEALDNDTPTAEDRFALLSRHFGNDVALVHGRLKASEKEQTMARFASGETKILAATTVIEVGVDVPEATIIVIDGAEHFGLAQLHQLRGRVGRGSKPSHAVLLYTPPISKTARQRLAMMRETNDGFKIAEEDLKLRGPGEILGQRQSGFASLRFADMARDSQLIEDTRTRARHLLDQDPLLQSEETQAARVLLQLFDCPLHRPWLDAG